MKLKRRKRRLSWLPYRMIAWERLRDEMNQAPEGKKTAVIREWGLALGVSRDSIYRGLKTLEGNRNAKS